MLAQAFKLYFMLQIDHFVLSASYLLRWYYCFKQLAMSKI